MPDKYQKRLPKFADNNIIIGEEHLANFYNFVGEVGVVEGHRDVVKKLFALFLEEQAKVWFRGLSDNNIQQWDEFHTVFTKRWAMCKDGRMLVLQLHKIKKKENEKVKEFDDRLKKLVDIVSERIRPKDDAILLHYTNVYEGHFNLML